VPFTVHLRPNGPYLMFLLVGVAALVGGLLSSGIFWPLVACAGGLLVVLFGAPVVLSTVCRVPVLVVDDHGVRFPLLGVRLGWPDIARVARQSDLRRPPPAAVLVVVPADVDATVRQVRPWLRRDIRANLTRYGAPIVLSDASLNRPLDTITEAVARRRPVS
jgi:hypothetical protein